MANEVQTEQPITEQMVRDAIDVLARIHKQRNGSLIILSSFAGVAHMSGPRFEIEKLLRWQAEKVDMDNTSFLNDQQRKIDLLSEAQKQAEVPPAA